MHRKIRETPFGEFKLIRELFADWSWFLDAEQTVAGFLCGVLAAYKYRNN